MLDKVKTIIRDFTISVVESNNHYDCTGYVASNEDLTSHEIHLWYLSDTNGKSIDIPYQEESDGSWYINLIIGDEDITFEQIKEAVDSVYFGIMYKEI